MMQDVANKFTDKALLQAWEILRPGVAADPADAVDPVDGADVVDDFCSAAWNKFHVCFGVCAPGL